MPQDYRPLQLMPNQIYPTYQLRAQVANPETPADDAMKLVVLETMAWLRERFRALDMPEEIKLPEPGAYRDFDLTQIKPFRVDRGYIVEVAYRHEDRAWALELREPDLGPRPEEQSSRRKPAPGRIFTTNIAFRIQGGVVDCGFRTMVSELLGEKTPCEVFRLAVIRRLIDNPALGLKQDKRFRIVRTPYQIDEFTELKHLIRFLGEVKRQLPAVVLAQCPQHSACGDPAGFMESLTEAHGTPTYLEAILETRPALRSKLPVPEGGFYEAFADTARHRMGYAYFFYLSRDLVKKYNEEAGAFLSPGDCAIIIPRGAKGRNAVHPYDEEPAAQARTLKLVEDETQEFLKGQDIPFDGVWFLPEILRRNQDDRFAQSVGRVTLDQIKDALSRQYGEIHRKELDQIQGIHAQDMRRIEKEIERDRGENEKYRARAEAEKTALEGKVGSLERSLETLTEELEWMWAKAALPRQPGELAAWVAGRYTGRLVFHDKAVSLMKDVKSGDVDLELLCSALEFLATEYRSTLTGEMTPDESNLACARKYGRPFEVAPLGGLSVEAYSSEYKIRYYLREDGKRHEDLLDRHLRVGNDNEYLLRVYFLYDSDQQLIVVGSLPKHLSTLSYK